MKKNQMTKSFLLGGTLFLVACGTQAQPVAPTENVEVIIADTETRVVRVWSDNATSQVVRERQVADWNATVGAEEGIYIDYVIFGGGWADTIRLAAQTDEAPEIFRPNGAFIREFIDAGFLHPLSVLPDMEDFIAKYDGQLIVNHQIFDDEVFTVPWNLTTYRFLINRDIFDRNSLEGVPETWEEVREFARIITENGGGEEFGFILGLQSPWTMSAYLHRPAGVIMGHHGFNHHTLNFEFYRLAPVIDAISGMLADGSVFPGASGLDADAKRAQFGQGRVGMIPAASFDVGAYNSTFYADFNWEVHAVPSLNNGPSPYRPLVDGTNILGIGTAALASPEMMEAVSIVFRWLHSDEIAAELYEEGLYIPIRQEAIDLAAGEPELRGFAEFADNADALMLIPTPEGHVILEGEGINGTLIYAIANPNADPLTVLTDLDSRLNVAIHTQLTPEELATFGAYPGRDNRR